ncbi:MAG: hypothetical protein IJ313_01240 [Clostridia bacterium]|nr:hypothetical protein [Clostridia bacterium]
MVKTSAQLSVQSEKMVRGYAVKRLPLGDYLRAIDALRETPETVMAELFPGMNEMDMLGTLKKMDKNMLAGLMIRAMGVIPAEAVKLLSVLTGVDQEALMSDPAIGLDGAAEMLEAFWELNGIENFIRAAERMAAQVKQLREKTGSKG